MVDYRYLWAKSDPYSSLVEHLINTGLCAERLLRHGVLQPVANKVSEISGLSADEVVSLFSYLAALHDIGKAHPYFQAKDMRLPHMDELREEGLLSVRSIPYFRHEEYSAEILKRVLPCVLNASENAAAAISAAIGLHHQGKQKSDTINIKKYCKPSEWEKLQNQINKVLIAKFAPPKIGSYEGCDAFIYMLLGVTILSDWVSSSLSGDESDISTAIKRRGLDVDSTIPQFDGFCSLCSFIPTGSKRGVQEAADELGSDPDPLYIIEAPMGEGKSEAALYLAFRQMQKYGENGFYMALPTSATGNQMFSRINQLFDIHDLGKSRLLHGTAWMIDDVGEPTGSEPEPESVQWLAPLRRAMLSRFAVGTIDQAMLSVMKVKYGVLRLLGLAGKVLILDEIHAYDTYMQTIIERLLNWCRALGIPVVLLSATLPKVKKLSLLKAYGAEPVAEPSNTYPLITSVGSDGTVKERPVERAHMKRSYSISLKPYMNDAAKIAELAVSKTESGGCVCVLVNTVNTAQEVYKRLKKMIGDTELDLFHARFTAERRNEIERTVVRKYGKQFEHRPPKSILVATQVMEQSIDADFDALITELAPIDLLLQRMGRVHRFDNTERPDVMKEPDVTVLTSKAGYDDTTVYPGILMQRTEDLLRTIDRIETPAMIRGLVEKVYSAESDDEEKRFEMWAKNLFKNQLEAAAAEGGVLPAPKPDRAVFASAVPDFFRSDDENGNYSAKTRIGDGSVRIALVSMEEKAKLSDDPSVAEAKKLMLRSAQVRSSRFGDPPEDAVGKGLLKGVVLLTTDENGYAHWGGYRIQNDNELGVLIEKE